MPEHIRALIVILFLSTTVFAFAKQPVSVMTETGSFTRRRNLWFFLTLAAFLSYSFWIYALIAIPTLLYANRQESNPPALFFFILFALPASSIPIPGMGLVNTLFNVSHTRLMELFVLLPAFLALRRQSTRLPFGRAWADRVFITYLFLITALYLRGTTATDTLRLAFYLFIDVFLPYFVFSRSLNSLQAFREVLSSFVMAMMLLAAIAIFEFLKHWLLFQPLNTALGISDGMTGYLGRDGMLRVMASAGQPIVLGYLMVVGIGFYTFLFHSIQKKFIRWAGLGLLIAGLIVPLSRGPWVGAVVFLFFFILTGRKPLINLTGLALAGMISLSLIAALPGGERVINLLPFIGTTEKGNIDYREQLITNSMIVIQRNPWFGSIDSENTPEMEAMRQGQGIIDIVNSYLVVTLKTGFVGLGLFVGFFALTLLGIRRTMRLNPDKRSDEYLLGRVLLATLLSILLMIFTVSSISFIPIVYWSIAGMGLAYTQMVNRNEMRSDAPR